ncbi:hypothetical protein LY78DRAFT_18732 [Colletotrichum sublineola]|nr:hypothetical protein LY78DRAFT_18732 [Colletotrichum sublineola]
MQSVRFPMPNTLPHFHTHTHTHTHSHTRTHATPAPSMHRQCPPRRHAVLPAATIPPYDRRE